jgi:hypothetical protein
MPVLSGTRSLALLAAALLAPAASAQLAPYARGTVTTVNDLRGSFVAAGTALRGTGGSGVIVISGIPFGSTVKEAVLYWTILGDDPMPAGADSIQLDTETFTGTLIGSTASPCQSMDRAYVFRADVTYWISGDGGYTVSNALDSGNPSVGPVAEGASLVVLYSNPSLGNRDFALVDGAALTDTPGTFASTTVTGFNASTPVTGASAAFIVADGEASLSDSTLVNGFVVGVNALNGSDAPGGVEYWDTDLYDVSAVMTGGSTSVPLAVAQGDDCVVWAASPLAVVSPLPSVDVVTENLTPIVVAGSNFRMRVTATNNTGANVPLTANIDVFRASGQHLGSMLLNKNATAPASAAAQKTFQVRIPASLPAGFRGIPLYVKTTLVTRPGGVFIDDDHVVMYVQ